MFSFVTKFIKFLYFYLIGNPIMVTQDLLDPGPDHPLTEMLLETWIWLGAFASAVTTALVMLGCSWFVSIPASWLIVCAFWASKASISNSSH